MIGSMGCVGGAGGDVIALSPVSVGPAATGVVSQLTSNLPGTVTWSKVSGASNLAVASNGAVSVTAALGAGGTNVFVARAANAAGDAVEKAFTLTGVAVPAAPTIAVTPGAGQNSLAITDGANNGAAITAHKVYRGLTSGAETLLGTFVGASPYVDMGLTNGTVYYYKVSAVNSVGEGAQSSEVSGAPNVFLGNFKAAVAAARAGTSDVKIWMQGDSTTFGTGANYTGTPSGSPPVYPVNADTNGTASAYPYTPAHLLAADYTSQAGTVGVNAQEAGIVGFGLQNATTYPLYDTRVAMGGWAASAGGGFASISATGAMLDFNFGVPANRIDFGLRNTAAGVFNVYAADGTTLLGTITLVGGSDLTNPAKTFQSLTVPAGTTRIKLDWVSGVPSVYMIQPVNTLVKQMYIYKNGWPATQIINNGVSGTAQIAPRQIIANVKPNLVIIDSYINECTATTPAPLSTYDTVLQSFIDTAKTNGADVLLIFGHHTDAADGTNNIGLTYTDYKATMTTVAARNNVPLLDLMTKPEFADLNTQKTGGMMDGGSIHLSQAGYAKKEQYLRQFLGLS